MQTFKNILSMKKKMNYLLEIKSIFWRIYWNVSSGCALSYFFDIQKPRHTCTPLCKTFGCVCFDLWATKHDIISFGMVHWNHTNALCITYVFSHSLITRWFRWDPKNRRWNWYTFQFLVRFETKRPNEANWSDKIQFKQFLWWKIENRLLLLLLFA